MGKAKVETVKEVTTGKETKQVFVVARVLETLGMAEKTAKGFATRKCNALNIIRDDNGATGEKEVLAILKTYSDSKTSKYGEIANKVMKELSKTGTIKGLSNEPSVTKPKASPFIAGKVLKLVLEEFKENEELQDFIKRETEKLEELEK